MTSSNNATPGRPCPWQACQNDALSASTTVRRANRVPVIHVATEAQVRAKARRDAMIWLRCVTADPSSSRLACVAACEVRLAIEFGKRPSAGAVAWLVGLCDAADPDVGDEARNAARVARVKP